MTNGNNVHEDKICVVDDEPTAPGDDASVKTADQDAGKKKARHERSFVTFSDFETFRENFPDQNAKQVILYSSSKSLPLQQTELFFVLNRTSQKFVPSQECQPNTSIPSHVCHMPTFKLSEFSAKHTTLSWS